MAKDNPALAKIGGTKRCCSIKDSNFLAQRDLKNQIFCSGFLGSKSLDTVVARCAIVYDTQSSV